MSPEPKNFGTRLGDLENQYPELVQSIKTHFADQLGENWENWTLGQIAHLDTYCGQSDPRLEAAHKISGNEAARGGSGPKKR